MRGILLEFAMTTTMRVNDQPSSSSTLAGFGHGPIHGFSTLLEVEDDIRNRDMHRQLKEDLVEHIWQRFGQNQA